MNIADVLQDAYLEYLNDYLTYERFAADKGLTEDEAAEIINAGRKIHAYRTEG